MLDTHASYVEEILYIKALCKGSALHALLCRLDVLVRCEVVHDQGDLLPVEYAVKARFFEFVNG